MATPTRPSVARQLSKVPGGFDTDDDLSPIKTSFDDEDFEKLNAPMRSQADPPPADNSLLSEDERSMMGGEGDTYLQEREMRRQLEDVDSTFLPEVSPAGNAQTTDPPCLLVLGPIRPSQALHRTGRITQISWTRRTKLGHTRQLPHPSHTKRLHLADRSCLPAGIPLKKQ